MGGWFGVDKAQKRLPRLNIDCLGKIVRTKRKKLVCWRSWIPSNGSLKEEKERAVCEG